MKTITCITSAFLAISGISICHGQIRIAEGVYEKNAYFRVSSDSTAFFSYYEVRDTQAFRELAAKKHKAANFPLIFVKKAIFNPFTDLVQQYETQLYSLYALDKHNQALDGIQRRKIDELIKIDSLKEERIKNFRSLAEDYRRANDTLSNRLKETLDIKMGTDNGSIRKKILTAMLGGAVGFSLASLLGAFK